MRIIFQIIILLVYSTVASAHILEVGKNKRYKQIKSALADSKKGDSLIIHSGFYKEGNIIINKSISLIGIGLPIIDGDRKFEVITIKANHVLIKGLKIQHSGYATLDDPGGIKIQEANYVSIIQNVLYDNFFGVYIQYGRHCIVKNNTIVAFGKEEQEIGNGIHAWKSDSLLIIGNNIKGHRDGIYFEFVTHSIIWRNIAIKNIRYGLHFMFSNDDTYITNVFKNNGSGVAVMFSNHVTMLNNKFEENWGDAAYGLLLKEISDAYISGNIFQKNTSGIFMEGTNRIVAEKNLFQKNGWAMQIQASCMDNIVQQNNFIGNTFDIGTNGNVVLNTIQQNYWDKYEGYDLNKDGIGDIPYRPLSMFSVIVEKNPSSMLLFRSLMVTLLDKSEKIFPTLTPENFMDTQPQMKQHNI